MMRYTKFMLVFFAVELLGLFIFGNTWMIANVLGAETKAIHSAIAGNSIALSSILVAGLMFAAASVIKLEK